MAVSVCRILDNPTNKQIVSFTIDFIWFDSLEIIAQHIVNQMGLPQGCLEEAKEIAKLSVPIVIASCLSITMNIVDVCCNILFNCV